MLEHVFLANTERSYIDVILKDGTYHHFTPRVLDVLLESHRVHKFKRTGGWATIGVDPVRVRKPLSTNNQYVGSERRTTRH
jgi:hypothetical protein